MYCLTNVSFPEAKRRFLGSTEKVFRKRQQKRKFQFLSHFEIVSLFAFFCRQFFLIKSVIENVVLNILLKRALDAISKKYRFASAKHTFREK